MHCLSALKPGVSIPSSRPDISFFRFPNFWPIKGHFLAYFNKPFRTGNIFCLPLFSGCCVGVDHWFHFCGNPRHSSHPSTFRSSAFVACRYVSAPVDWRPSKAFSAGISLVCLLGCPNICKFNFDNIPNINFLIALLYYLLCNSSRC